MRALLLAVAMLAMTATAHAQMVRLYAAGSLKAVMADMTAAFEAATPGVKVETVLGASGLLRERIEKGEVAHVFASADTGHPKRLAEQGRTASPVAVFARNELCALVREGIAVTSDTLLDVMLDAKVRVGTSTPKADPSGDYAFALFGKADGIKPGAKATLETKALQLTGGPTSERAPEGKNLYGWVMASNRADVFLTYCTNAMQAKAEVPSLTIVAIPKALNVGADYGLIVLNDAPADAQKLAAFIRSDAGRKLLAKHGFGAGD
jgi:ABC-type molybdate transport system substrate-binding protein